MNRRSFFKLGVYTLGAISVFKKGGLVLGEALGLATPDEGLEGKLKYVSIIKDPVPKAAKSHVRKIRKYLASKKFTDSKVKLAVAADKALPKCQFCKFYVPDEKGGLAKGYGKCKQVAKKKGQGVNKQGWCQMFNVQKKPKKIKANIAS